MYSRLWLDETIDNNNTVVTNNGFDAESVLLKNAVKELTTIKAVSGLNISLVKCDREDLGKEGFEIEKNGDVYTIKANNENAVLFGAFRFINMIRLNKSLDAPVKEVPVSPLRMLNHWDNMDNSIERGYSGESFLFKDNDIVIDDRTVYYARVLASAGYNGVVINNVNVKQAACDLINERFIDKVNKLSELFSSYGIKMFMSLNYASPIDDPEVSSADPLDEKVIKWWEKKMAYIYSKVPTFGGFLVKADSEGRPGPFTYDRTQAEGANMLARAIKPYGGIIIWRCFVYNCRQDWRDLKTDRARAAYDYFNTLDGDFEDNVIIQIKNGPVDFQVREPVSPLFGAMPHTNEMMEFQIAQEYTGQQRHVCFLIPWFKEVLSFDIHAKDAKSDDTTVLGVVTGKTYGNALAGICAVTNTGNDYNWTGHDLAAANLYGLGRLAFEPSLSSEEIAREWIVLTYGNNEKVIDNVTKILMMSWPAYEKYNAPLGIGWMVHPEDHYGPDPDGYEYSVWGTYHKADHFAIGVERNSTGTGYSTQYNEPLKSMYEKPETTPDELKLFFHRLPYTYVLKSGKTVIQHIYDTHYEGAEDVKKMSALWQDLKGIVPDDAFERVTKRFEHQVEHSERWRDVINSYFYRKTLIPDEKGRPLY